MQMPCRRAGGRHEVPRAAATILAGFSILARRRVKVADLQRYSRHLSDRCSFVHRPTEHRFPSFRLLPEQGPPSRPFADQVGGHLPLLDLVAVSCASEAQMLPSDGGVIDGRHDPLLA